MVERRDHLRLLDEALAEVAVAAEVVGERLDRSLAAEDRVLGLVDEAHPAAAEQSAHAVAGDLRADAEGLAHAAGRTGFAIPTSCPMLTTRSTAYHVQEADAMADYVLEIVEGPEAGRMIPLDRSDRDRPRRQAASVALQQDELLSRRHVRITPEADGARVEDLGSRNGTFVDGDEIHSPAHLGLDGQLLVGVTLLQLRTAETVAAGGTALRPIPAEFTTLRPLPAVESAGNDDPPARAWTGRRRVGAGLRPRVGARAELGPRRLRALPAAGRPHEGEGEGRADRDLRARGGGRDALLRAQVTRETSVVREIED